jgi:hypothetical protein
MATFRWLLLGVLLLVTIILGIRHAKALWNLIFGSSDDAGDPSNFEQAATSNAQQRCETFADLANPFLNPRNTPDWVVRQVFHATEVWGREHRVQRHEDETPDEFLRRLGRKYGDASQAMTQLGWIYSRMAYANKSATASEAEGLQSLWDWMKKNSARVN